MRFAWLLMLVYVPMMLATTFHHHAEAEGTAAITSYCQDCTHHIHHDGHLTTQQISTHECVLCHFQSLPYLVSTIVHIAVFIAMVHTALVVPCLLLKTRQGETHSTRAPPAFPVFVVF